MDDRCRTLEEIEWIALGRQTLTLFSDETSAVAKAHAFLCTAIEQRRRIYGVTTDYEPLATTDVDPKQSALTPPRSSRTSFAVTRSW